MSFTRLTAECVYVYVSMRVGVYVRVGVCLFLLLKFGSGNVQPLTRLRGTLLEPKGEASIAESSRTIARRAVYARRVFNCFYIHCGTIGRSASPDATIFSINPTEPRIQSHVSQR